MEAETRCGFIAVVGAPNAGKSTLINRLVGSKVSIVTPKVQTTRTLLRAIVMVDQSQIILVDTPGIFQPRRTLDAAMVQAAWSGAVDADAILLLVDVTRESDGDQERILSGLEGVPRPVYLVLNKIDRISRPKLLEMTRRMNDRFPFGRTFMISALNGDGLDDLRAFLAAAVPPGPWLYPDDQVADIPMRLLAAEITREQVFLRLHQELPYASAVETEGWSELDDGSVRIEQVIYVERENQKKIVIGKGGRTIKEIGRTAREHLKDMLARNVHLMLFVKVRERWSEDPERYEAMGLSLPRK